MESESEHLAENPAEIHLSSGMVCSVPFGLQFHRSTCCGSQRRTGFPPVSQAEVKLPHGPRL